MTTIKCEINGKVTEIEVEESFASAYLEIEAESKREQWRQDWRNRKHNCSLEAMEAQGVQFAAPDTLTRKRRNCARLFRNLLQNNKKSSAEYISTAKKKVKLPSRSALPTARSQNGCREF